MVIASAAETTGLDRRSAALPQARRIEAYLPRLEPQDVVPRLVRATSGQ